jgi:hypothetical protein
VLTRCYAAIALLALAPVCADASLQGTSAKVRFASAAEGRQILTRPDEFVERMSAFDRAARLKTDRTVTEQEYLAFVGENVLEWSEDERTGLSATIDAVEKRLRELTVTFPKDVVLIKTSGREEGGAAYTRANAIILPLDLLRDSAGWERLVSHELFHIMSRQNPKLRERACAAIGFKKCAEAVLPPDLRPRQITNPDAPRNEYFITVKHEGKEVAAIPILFAEPSTYDPKRGGEFFEYVQMRLLIAEKVEDLARANGSRKVVPLEQVSGFFEQIGRNTSYIIHPEETLAENFAHLIEAKDDARSPEILAKLKAALAESH